MPISSISPSLIPHDTGLMMPQGLSQAEEPGKETFTEFLGRSIKDVDKLLGSADKSSTDLATGKSENLHESMINIEKAETAFKLLVQVRNKALEAYHEVMRMQV